MADHRRFELDELTIRPGTYFNPQTEVLLVVDDSPELDHEIFDMDEFEGEQWVLISDESALDEHRRDELLERFRATHHAAGEPSEDDEDSDADDDDDDDEDEDEDEDDDLDVEELEV
jgi:hypothetical protein